MPSITKLHISSPLEAGTSLLDTTQLPPQLTSALEYVSSRLARKKLHLSLIVVRKDINILSPQSSPTYSASTASSPATSLFSTASTTFSRSKHSSTSSISDAGSITSTSSSSSLSRTRWPGLPSNPKDTSALPARITSPVPASPVSVAAQQAQNPYGLTLMHASLLTEKAEKILRRTIAKAEKKFDIGSGWLPTTSLSSPLNPQTHDILHRSLIQNEILFSSEGLTLLALDRIYTFKMLLHVYSTLLSRSSLTLAVDELHRLVLAQGGKPITKSYLMRAYAWMGVSLAALVDVNEGYKVAYGGARRRSGVIEVSVGAVALSPSLESVSSTERARRSPPALQTTFNTADIRRMKMQLCVSTSPATLNKPASNFSSSSSSVATLTPVEVGESAKGRDVQITPRESVPRGGFKARNEEYSPFAALAAGGEDRGPHRRGPMTPNGFEDITPVTKGEWCFLMVGDGWKDASRRAPAVVVS